MNKGHCDICGQALTDASGHWRITMADYGIFHNPAEQIRCCAWCKESIDEALAKIRTKHREERGKHHEV